MAVALASAVGCSGGTGEPTTTEDATTEADTESTTTGTETTDPTIQPTSTTNPTSTTTMGPTTTDDPTTTTDDPTTTTDDPTTGTTAPDPLEIEGMWTDAFSIHNITSELWTIDADSYTIAWYDNDIDTLIAQNGPDNGFNPDAWSKFQWTYVDDALYYCQIVFDGATQEDAENGPDADDSDPLLGGCGDFPWSLLAPL